MKIFKVLFTSYQASYSWLSFTSNQVFEWEETHFNLPTYLLKYQYWILNVILFPFHLEKANFTNKIDCIFCKGPCTSLRQIKNSLILIQRAHSSEIRCLCLMKCSTFLEYKKNLGILLFIVCYFIFPFLMNALVFVNIYQDIYQKENELA